VAKVLEIHPKWGDLRPLGPEHPQGASAEVGHRPQSSGCQQRAGASHGTVERLAADRGCAGSLGRWVAGSLGRVVGPCVYLVRLVIPRATEFLAQA
jgi:hypothetical protein